MAYEIETDYLVIGAGSGGCAAARVLAERTDAAICVIESGGTNQRDEVTDPARWPELLESDAAWHYSTVPQVGAGGRAMAWAMGRILGGSSSVNGMKWMRGAPWDYDAWEAQGNPGWGAGQVYEVFRALEAYPAGDPDIRGWTGPISLQEVAGDHPLTAAFIEACQTAGFRLSADVNSLDAEGVGRNQLNIADGRRVDAASALLAGVESRLDLRTATTAVQLCIDEKAQAVTAVRCAAPEGEVVIRVSGEVILAAGAIETPHLLLLSGVGPADELAAVGVHPRVDLPGVGRNLHDHVGAPIVFQSPRAVPASAYQGTEATLYLRSSGHSEHFDAQVSMQLFPARLPDPYTTPVNGFSLFPGLLKPTGRGTLSLRSASPHDPPLIDPAYLREGDDLARLRDVVNVARELVADEAYQLWRGSEVGPGPAVTSRKELEAYVQSVAATYYHPVGTCQMGAESAGAVVDPRLMIHGLENVRIADNSVMPEIISGNTSAPAMMIGWRAGEFAAKKLAARR